MLSGTNFFLYSGVASKFIRCSTTCSTLIFLFTLQVGKCTFQDIFRVKIVALNELLENVSRKLKNDRATPKELISI